MIGQKRDKFLGLVSLGMQDLMGCDGVQYIGVGQLNSLLKQAIHSMFAHHGELPPYSFLQPLNSHHPLL
jgi:hypothetical protein